MEVKRIRLISLATGCQRFDVVRERNQVEVALSSCQMRQDVLACLNGDLLNKARFCAAVLDMAKCDDRRDILCRGRKIVATFLQTGSQYQVSIPENIEINSTSQKLRTIMLFDLEEKFAKELEQCDVLQVQLPSIWSKVYPCQPSD